MQGDKKKNEKATLKPWITKSIKQSIKVRDRPYKNIIKTKNIQLLRIKEISFNNYRNEIEDLDSWDISEHFNNLFTSIGQDQQKNIAPTKKHFQII